MHYIYQILAMILIGISVGAMLSRRSTLLLVGSAVAVVLGVVALAMPSWQPLLVGGVVYFVAQLLQRDPARA